MTTHPAITELIASFVTETDLAGAPPQLREQALRAVIDTVGIAIAARDDAGYRTLLRTLQPDLAPGRVSVWASGIATTAPDAALLNGLAAHALDYDDVAHPIYGHPSVALIPALLAVAEDRGSSGRELLDAYIVGFEVICALAAGLNIRPHYARGWHSTGTTGVVAAAAAAGRLMGLPADQVRHALGIAASMASGSRQNFGTMTKPLHPGLSSRNAVLAARLAANGFTADTSQLEAPLGYFAMYGVDGDPEAAERQLAKRWALIDSGINVKKYPCCYNTHRTADATLGIAAQDRPGIDSITGIAVTVEPGGAAPLIRHRPVTGLEAKFSAEYVTAASLLDGRISLASFTDEAVMRPEAQRLLRKVTITESATPPVGDATWDYAYAAVQVAAAGGTRTGRVDVPRGDARLPLTDAELDDKFRDCVAHSGTGWDADEILAAVRRLPESDRVSGFTSLGR
ncbi:MAG TPA: MmgE/PrpD family protein [Trebonia sp.]